MPDLPKIAIFAESAAQTRYLAEIVGLSGAQVLAAADAAAADLVLTTKDEIPALDKPVLFIGMPVRIGADARVHSVSSPVRAGQLIAKIQNLCAPDKGRARHLVFVGGALDTIESLWIAPDEAPLRLTEKEVDILRFLHEASGETVSREALLEKVWAYARDVETHTLETHIYRLRQKIEIDPANPVILLTRENGYAVSI